MSGSGRYRGGRGVGCGTETRGARWWLIISRLLDVGRIGKLWVVWLESKVGVCGGCCAVDWRCWQS